MMEEEEFIPQLMYSIVDLLVGFIQRVVTAQCCVKNYLQIFYLENL